MKWLRTLFGSKIPDSDQALDQAIQMVQQGEQVEAASLLQQVVQQTQEVAGAPSLEYAKACFNFGILKLAMEDAAGAAAQCQLAADSCPDSDQGRKDRLTYLMNAGQMLIRSNKASEAVGLLEIGLQERIALYGEGHAGVAYGQQVLAEAFLADGRTGEGVRLAADAAQIFLNEQHQEYPGTLALYSALMSADGQDPSETLASFPADVDREHLDAFVHAAIEVCQVMPESSGVRFAEQFADWVDRTLPTQDVHRLNTLANWGNLAADHDDADSRCRAADRHVSTAEQMDLKDVLVNAYEGRAFSNSARGADPEIVRADYQAALQVAEESGLNDEIPGVLRNWAIWEAELGREAEAAQLYQEAMQKAEAAGDQELLCRVKIAAGIFHQHAKRMEEAEPLLAVGIAGLPATHPDAACGILHQVALKERIPCPCDGDEVPGPEAITTLANKFFVESGFGDLLEEVGFDKGKGLRLNLRRAPTDEELQKLQVTHEVFVNLLQTNAQRTR